MRFLLLLLVVPLLMSCSRDNPYDYRTTNSVQLNTQGLEGCTYHRVSTPDVMPTLHVIRCPRTQDKDASTTTGWKTGGKNAKTHTVTMIDGDGK